MTADRGAVRAGSEGDGASILRATEEADARYRRLIEQSGVGLFQTATSGRILWVNPAAAQICGYEDPDDLLASVENVRDLYLDVSRRDEFARFVDQNERVSGFEYEIRHKNGSIRWISVDARAVRNEGGDLEGFEGTIQDVTDRKLLEASTDAMSSQLDPVEAVSSVAEVLRRAIPFRQLTLAVIEGPTFRRLVSLGGGPTEPGLPTNARLPLEGNSIGEVVVTGRPVLVQDTSEGRWGFDTELAAAGVGSYAIFPLIDDSGVFATFNVGMKEARAISEQIFALLAKLAAGVAPGAKNILAFEKQREVLREMEEVTALKNEFFASVSHDLRNPLAVISGIIDAMRRRWGSLPDERKLEMLTSIASSTERVLHHLKRDLDIALIESGEIDYEKRPFKLDEVISRTTRAFSDSESGHRFVTSVPEQIPPAFGDPGRYTQVTENLLSNAVKFSPPDSTIRTEVVQVGDELQVSIADEGPGVDADQQAVMFGRFGRLDTGKPGTGMGLYISRSMVEAQGGRLWVESSPGTGACFRFTIPVAG